MHTPFFPAFRARLAACGRRSVQTVRQYTLAQLSHWLRDLLPPQLFVPPSLVHPVRHLDRITRCVSALPVVGETVEVINVEGRRESLRVERDRIEVRLPGDAKMPPPLLVIDRSEAELRRAAEAERVAGAAHLVVREGLTICSQTAGFGDIADRNPFTVGSIRAIPTEDQFGFFAVPGRGVVEP